MKNLRLILTLIIGAVIGFSFCHLFHGNPGNGMADIAVHDAKPSGLEKTAQQLEISYQQKSDSLTQQTEQLNQVLKQTRLSLNRAKSRNMKLQTQVYDLIDQQQVYKASSDTVAYMAGCDSLEKKTVALIAAADHIDSLHAVVIDNLGTQLQNRDSTIALKEQLEQSLKTLLEQSLSQQRSLEQQARFYKKKYKRGRLTAKLRSIGFLLAGGLAARLLIH